MFWNIPYVISGSQFIESLEKNVLPGPLHQDSFPGTTNTQPNEIFYTSHTPELKEGRGITVFMLLQLLRWPCTSLVPKEQAPELFRDRIVRVNFLHVISNQAL